MGLGDSLLNSVFGTNIRTIKVSTEQLAEIIDEKFIKPAVTKSELDKIEDTIKGNITPFPKEMDSMDNKFHLYVSGFQRGLTTHRTVWVKNVESQEVFEWKGYTLGSLKDNVITRINRRRINL